VRTRAKIVEAGVTDGASTRHRWPLQIFAYRSAQLAQVNMARLHLGAETLLGARLLELLRIRSAQLGECETLQPVHVNTIRSVTRTLPAFSVRAMPRAHTAGTGGHRIPRSAFPLTTIRLTDAFYQRLGEHFHRSPDHRTRIHLPPQPMGLHRFIHTLDGLRRLRSPSLNTPFRTRLTAEF